VGVVAPPRNGASVVDEDGCSLVVIVLGGRDAVVLVEESEPHAATARTSEATAAERNNEARNTDGEGSCRR
jgi:hypothetical protein